jgi:hypothetical protein
MYTRALILTLLLVVGFTAQAVSTQAQAFDVELDSHGRWVNGLTEPWWFPDGIPSEDIKSAQSLWSGIGNQNELDIWSGDYFTGGGTHGSYLRWTPGGYVLFHVDKCQAKVMGFSYGKVVATKDVVQLTPEKTVDDSAKHHHIRDAGLRLLPVTWRDTRYLVPEDQISDFGDYVAGLGEYNSRDFMLAEYAQFFSKPAVSVPESTESPDATNTITDKFTAPVVPLGYERFIKRPIDGRIISLGKSYVRKSEENEWWDELIIPVVVGAGSTQGLKTKMVLRVISVGESTVGDEYVEITAVSRSSAKGFVARPVRKKPCVKFAPTDDCKNPDYSSIKVGTQVTTNPVKED